MTNTGLTEYFKDEPRHLFRFWDKREKAMLIAQSVCFYADGSFGLDEPYKDSEWIEYAGKFTGMVRHQQMLFSGDIISIELSDKRRLNYVVVFRQGTFCLKHLSYDLRHQYWGSLYRLQDNDMESLYESMRIEGNVFQNPELL